MADYATLTYDIDSGAARTAATDLAKLNAASAKAAGGADKLNKTLRDTRGRFRSSYDVAKQYGSEIQSLAAKYNPTLSAVYQYQQAQLEVNRAVALGVLTQQQADAALERTAAQLRATATASQKFGAAQGQARHHVANLSFQLNDIGMMMATGQNPFTLMMQQGPQVAQIFSQMNQEGRKIGPTLAGAFKMFLNPTTAVTLALVGGFAALGQWAMGAIGASRDAKTFEESLSNLEGSAGRVNSAYRLMARDGLEEVYQAYGRINEGVIRNIQLLTEAAVLQELQAIKDAAAAIKEEFTGGWFTTDVDDIRNLFNTTNDNARSLLNTIDQIKNAKTFDEQAEAAVRLRDALLSGGLSIESFEGEARRAVIEIVKMADGAERLKEQVDRSKKLGEQFARLDLAGGVIAAGNAALVLAHRMGITLATAQRLAALGDQGVSTDPSGKRYSGRGGDPREMGGSTFDLAVKEADAWIKLQEEIDKTRKNAGGGGGGAELARAEKQFQSLRELMERESIFQVAEYEKRQAQLDNAYAKKLLSEQQYQEMRKQLQMLYFGSEYEQNIVNYQMDLDQLNAAFEQKLIAEEQYLMRKRQLQWDYAEQLQQGQNNLWSVELDGMAAAFGEMNKLAGGGYDKLLRAQQIFAAASALMSTYTGAAKALELPFPQNMVAMAKVLAAGMGLVNAIKGGGGGGGSAASTATAAAARQEPERQVLVRLEGDEWLVNMADNIMTQIYEQSRDGRVIVAREY